MTSSYPRRENTVDSDIGLVRNCTDFPSLPLPQASINALPGLPSPARDLEFAPGYTVTTHIIPAAYPRYSYQEPKRFASSSYTIPNDAPPDSAPKDVRTDWSSNTAKKLVEKRRDVLRAQNDRAPKDGPLGEGVAEDAGPVLCSVINRYARTKSPKDKRDFGLTVVACHANGLHKETWEPAILRLLELSEKRTTGICIDEIWSIDAANTGDSALLNEGNLCDTFDWLDHARDVLNFVENYLPAGPHSASAPPPSTHLSRVEPSISASRIANGFKDRHVVGWGHSWGACVLTNAAVHRPKLFLSLTLVDPVISPDYFKPDGAMIRNTLMRRQEWPSRKEACEILARNPFFGAWHPNVLDAYVNYALVEKADGSVRLKMDRFQEAVCFADFITRQETWNLLPSLDEAVKLRWIMAGKPSTGPPDTMNQMVWRRMNNSSNVIIEKSGHLITQEAPYELAQETLYGWRVMLAETQDPIWARLKL